MDEWTVVRRFVKADAYREVFQVPIQVVGSFSKGVINNLKPRFWPRDRKCGGEALVGAQIKSGNLPALTILMDCGCFRCFRG